MKSIFLTLNSRSSYEQELGVSGKATDDEPQGERGVVSTGSKTAEIRLLDLEGQLP